jgi:hypothetical protein
MSRLCDTPATFFASKQQQVLLFAKTPRSIGPVIRKDRCAVSGNAGRNF